MGGAESVVFTGGIGENSAAVRERICAGLEVVGLQLDPDRNRSVAPGTLGEISADGSRLRALVIPTNEELLIARDTYRVVMDVPRRW
jgi:acetate kinase